MERHVRNLAVLYTAFVLFSFLGGALVLLLGPGSEVPLPEWLAAISTPGFMTVVLWGVVVYGILNLLGAVCLLARWSWARTYVLAVGFLNLPNLPLGTALGGYTIWVLSKEETRAAFVG